MRAVGLKAADLNGKSDPYVIVRAAAVEKKSKVIKRTLDPQWDEVVTLEGSSLTAFLATGLTLRVMDKDRITKDDPLGDVVLTLDELRAKDRHNYTLPLSTKGGPATASLLSRPSCLVYAAPPTEAHPPRSHRPTRRVHAHHLVHTLPPRSTGTLLFSVTWSPTTVVLPPSTPPHAPVTALPLSLPPPAALPPPRAAAPSAARPNPADWGGAPAVTSPPPPVDTTIPPLEASPATRAAFMAPLAVLWAPVSALLLALAFTAFALAATPEALCTAFIALYRARRFGPLAKLFNAAVAVAAALAFVPIATLLGGIVGLTHGAYIGGQYLAQDGASADFISGPVAWLLSACYGRVRPKCEAMLRQDAELPAAYVPLDFAALAPLSALAVGLVAAPLVALRIVAAGVYESPAAIVAATQSVMQTRRLGCLGKAMMVPIAAVLPLLLLAVSPLWGLFAGFLHGMRVGWTSITERQPLDLFSGPTASIEAAYHSIATGASSMVDEDKSLDSGFVPCDVAVLAPLGALLFALVGAPLVAAQLLGISLCPRALANALSLASSTRRLGPFARALTQFLLAVAFVLLLPPAAVVTGAVLGLLHGLVVGWRYFGFGEHYDVVRWPTELWTSSVLTPLDEKIAALRERDLANPPTADEVIIDVNPLLLLTACAAGLIGAVITSLVYLSLGLLFMLPMAFKMYSANSNICSSDFKIVEALIAFLLYLVLIPLIPLLTVLLTAWQPIEGFAVGFARITYSVIFHSNVGYLSGGCGCLFDALGFTGLLPAVGQLGTDISKRWEEREKPATKAFTRLTVISESMLHCFSDQRHRPSRASISDSGRYLGGEDSPDARSPPGPPGRLAHDGATVREERALRVEEAVASQAAVAVAAAGAAITAADVAAHAAAAAGAGGVGAHPAIGPSGYTRLGADDDEVAIAD